MVGKGGVWREVIKLMNPLKIVILFLLTPFNKDIEMFRNK